MSVNNEFQSQTTHTTCVTQDTRAVFSYDYFNWDDIDLELYLALVSYLHGIFNIPSVAFWQSLGLQLSLVWSRHLIRRKESALTFDTTLTRHLTLSRKFKGCIRILSLGPSIAALRFSLPQLLRNLDRGGGDIPLPPQPAEVGWRWRPSTAQADYRLHTVGDQPPSELFLDITFSLASHAMVTKKLQIALLRAEREARSEVLT